ncbi:MAG: SET domain-containing protein-lysine N-methyltransferase [Bacteroidetes bacterium]|nr:MAG: SET domain-containing protein-lysine N-methyltransferase [Bacteroidota bacterium]
MLLVKHKIAPSKIGGLGLFADEFIKKDTIIWKNNTDSELIISEEQKSGLSDYMQKVFSFHGYFDKKQKVWKLPLDNSRFMNHNNPSNTFVDESGNSVAFSDILLDEEITCNYAEFDGSERGFVY